MSERSKSMTADEIAETIYARELGGIDVEISTLNSQLKAAHARRERLVTGKLSFVEYVKATRNYRDT